MQTDFPRTRTQGNTIGILIGYTTMVIGVLLMGVGGIVLLRGSLVEPAPRIAAEAPGDSVPAPVAPVDEGAPAFDHDIVIRTIPQQLRYDISSITVKAGSSVRLTFENNDILEHNLLVVLPGSQEIVSSAALAMMSDPANAIAKGYVPEIDAVMHASKMLKAGETQTLEFTAPETPDTYHYICTFPGHAMFMRGNMIVE